MPDSPTLQTARTPSRRPRENIFPTADGERLFYRYWPALTRSCRGAIILFHRGHEHSGRMAHLVDELDLPGFAFFAWDARGHGRSPGARGDSPSIGTSVRDVQTFVDHIAGTHGIAVEDMAVVAQSVGAAVVAGWAHDYAPKLRAMVLGAPAFEVKLYVPLARPALRVLRKLRGNFFVNSYVKAKLLTHDRERIASFESDPLIAKAISVNILLGLHDLSERVVADAEAITIPTQLLISGNDWVVHHAPQHHFYERLGAMVKERHVLDGFYHDTFGEQDRQIALEHARRFILARFAQPPRRPSLKDADKLGFTRREADELARPLRLVSPTGLYWGIARLALRAGGGLSKGIRLGRETGFDSGSSLDYVYENEARGLSDLGRWIDRHYLDAVGWRGIRERKRHLEQLMDRAMERLRGEGAPVHLMDVAAGHGRYILDGLTRSNVCPDSVLLRDYSDDNVRRGSELIEARGLGDLVRFETADAFDANDLARARPRPTLVVVSGLYELFADNQLVRRSLMGIGNGIAEGGYLIYTGQPWHPQLELIARTLSSHRQGRPWVMRRRTQAELDELVNEAGFTKCEQLIDEWGIFTVSVARKNGRGQ